MVWSIFFQHLEQFVKRCTQQNLCHIPAIIENILCPTHKITAKHKRSLQLNNPTAFCLIYSVLPKYKCTVHTNIASARIKYLAATQTLTSGQTYVELTSVE